ncbi:MAG TPA: substrate-binding domain-containing protein [Hyphomicrobiaceae bacterium]|jgi:molybdate transport system substrate-binding protein|nr:substrate-binding domain-containing protein [Hyphomicrobiaceae bacterium]
MGIGALAAAATVGAAVLMGQANAAKAAEIAVFATTSLRQALEKLGPQFERASGHKLNYQLGTSAPLKRQIDAGGPFDLAILVPASLDALIKEGKVQPETRVDVARSAIGVAVKAGSPKPETDTAEALRRTLLAAKSISYSGEGASGKYFTGLLERLGIAAEVTPKLRPLPSGEAVAPVAKGEVEMAVITLANILGVPGVEIAGLLPRDMQHYTVYTAGVATTSRHAEAAKALIALLMAPDTTPAIEAAGMERVGP